MRGRLAPDAAHVFSSLLEKPRFRMNDSQPRRLLLIAYHFHPDLEVGAMRSVKFAKYLPEFGWQAHVVSVEPRYYERVDPTPLPFQCSVDRSGMWPTIVTLRAWLKKKSRPNAQSGQLAEGTGAILLATSGETQRQAPFWRRLIRRIAVTPDMFVGWLVPATWQAIRVARREKVDVLYTSGPPRTSYLVGLIASWVTGLPLVSDFRDPWTTGPPPETGLERFFARVDRVMETMVVRRSRLVLAATPGVRDRMVVAHRPTLDMKCVALINGFDLEDFPASTGQEIGDRNRVLSFVYTGTLYGGRDPRPLLTAIGEMVADGSLDRNSIRVDFYGPVEIDTLPLQRVIEEFSLQDVVAFRPSVKRQEYLSIIDRSDVLILLQADETPWALPAKNFEYLATGNEILLLSGPYALADFLKGYENVHRAAPGDLVAIKDCIARILDRIHSGARDRGRSLQSLSHMHKRELTRELARLLDQVVSQR